MIIAMVIFFKEKKTVLGNPPEFFYPKFDAFSFQNIFQYLFDFVCKTREQYFYFYVFLLEQKCQNLRKIRYG